ncbi:rhomboid-domain-containing protein [Choiromyces venosus 120613-1]|uniref:Rhomboid-domain-containing protein n=1 Tax=Choiromyces venosus 120613-1 TaxID=1336337 RepID=A0A3N4K0L7_9PEZI|nr:rhomboid-domain-containing protein [Choiromyces venosus 120613-1]
MLHLFTRSSTTILLNTSKKTCLKSAPSSFGYRILQSPRPQIRFFHHNTSKQFPNRKLPPKPEKPVLEPAINPSENLSSTPQPKLLDRLKAQGQLSQDEVPRDLSHFQRLFAPFIFTLAVCGGSYYFASTWTPPPLDARMFPALPQSVTTVAAIIAANAAVWLAWKIPLPISWRFLNRYFLCAPALPYSVGLLGSVFSHQSLTHLGFNMFALYVFGSTLCDQIGRGNFLGLYFSSGVIASFASLTHNVLRGRFHVYALGASGAAFGVLGAFTYLNPETKLTFIFLPFVALQAKYFMSGVAMLEAFGIVRGWQTIDNVAHLAGLSWGVGMAYWLEQRVKRRRELEAAMMRERASKRWW